MNIEEILNQIPYLVTYLISPPYPFDQWIFLIRNIFIIISLFLLFGTIYFISKTSWLKFRYLENLVEFFTYQPFGAKKITKQWEKIKDRLKIGSESESKLIIIEADLILSNVLEKMGFIGETFEERIKKITLDTLPNIQEVLEAHKIRNNIVYDPDYQLDLVEANKIILIYERALIGLQAL